VRPPSPPSSVMNSPAASLPRRVVRLAGELAVRLGRAEGTEVFEDELTGSRGLLKSKGLITNFHPLPGAGRPAHAAIASTTSEVQPAAEPAPNHLIMRLPAALATLLVLAEGDELWEDEELFTGLREQGLITYPSPPPPPPTTIMSHAPPVLISAEDVLEVGLQQTLPLFLLAEAGSVARREDMIPGRAYHDEDGGSLASIRDFYADTPSFLHGTGRFSALMKPLLGRLACVSRSWRAAISSALLRELSHNPPAWRCWTRGLASAAAEAAVDSPALMITRQQVGEWLRLEDAFFLEVTNCDSADGMSGFTVEQHGALLFPTIAFQPPPQTGVSGEGGSSTAIKAILPPTKIGGYPDWPFHDREGCPTPPDKTQLRFVAQVNLAHIKGCALANATGLLPRNGMLYFFLQPDYIGTDDATIGYNSSQMLKSVRCSVIHILASTAAALTAAVSAHSLEQTFGIPQPVTYSSTKPAYDSLTPPPMLYPGVHRDESNDYQSYASRAGPDRAAPLMLGHCAPPLWMAGSHKDTCGVNARKDDALMEHADSILDELWDVDNNAPLDDEADGEFEVAHAQQTLVPLLQFNCKSDDNLGTHGHYVVFMISKEDLQAHRFNNVCAYVQLQWQHHFYDDDFEYL
jgi:hypothetical protein